MCLQRDLNKQPSTPIESQPGAFDQSVTPYAIFSMARIWQNQKHVTIHVSNLLRLYVFLWRSDFNNR